MFTETFDAAADVGRSASRIRLLSYPEEEARRAQLAAEGKPRMLFLAPGCPPPTLLDQLEDWVRYPIEADELDARLAELQRRAEQQPSLTHVTLTDGILRVGEQWTTIPEPQWSVVQMLVDRMGAVVSDEEVGQVYASSDAAPNERAARSMMQRLGKRLADIGLVVRKVRGRGYLVELERQG